MATDVLPAGQPEPPTLSTVIVTGPGGGTSEAASSATTVNIEASSHRCGRTYRAWQSRERPSGTRASSRIGLNQGSGARQLAHHVDHGRPVRRERLAQRRGEPV